MAIQRRRPSAINRLIAAHAQSVTHQDVGQMDMYVRVVAEQFRGEGDNPTLGLIL